MKVRTAKRILQEKAHLTERRDSAKAVVAAKLSALDKANADMKLIHTTASDSYTRLKDLRQKLSDLEEQIRKATELDGEIEASRVTAALRSDGCNTELMIATVFLEKQQARLDAIEKEAVEAEARVKVVADAKTKELEPPVATVSPEEAAGRQLLAKAFSGPTRTGDGTGRFLANASKTHKRRFFSSRGQQ